MMEVEKNMLFEEEEMGGIPLEDVFDAYYECRRRKRNTYNAMAFEMDYERNCIELWRDINSGSYKPGRSIAFIITKPVIREVFAADFRDRVVHHLIALRIVPVLETLFIDDNYSTRNGRGTLFGIKHVEQHIRDCSENYTRDCYILKIDIKSFFMSINKQMLYDAIEGVIRKHYHEADQEMLLYLIRETVFSRPEKNCIRKSARALWRKLPKDKSLFGTDGSRGLPIGNLTSQLLALNYLNELDHLITEEWGIEHYGRYVDDMVMVHPSREHLIEVKNRVKRWLEEHGLKLHPNKLYLQHYAKGVLFVGSMLKPGRKYLSNRTVGFCYNAIESMNRLGALGDESVDSGAPRFVCRMNSYLGMMKHFSTYKMRRRVMGMVGKPWWNAIFFGKHLHKTVLKNSYNPLRRKASEIIEIISNDRKRDFRKR